MSTQITVGLGLVITKEIVQALEDAGVLSAGGDFNVSTIATDLKAVNAVEAVFKNHGMVPPAPVDEILSALPTVMSIFGIK